MRDWPPEVILIIEFVWRKTATLDARCEGMRLDGVLETQPAGLSREVLELRKVLQDRIIG